MSEENLNKIVNENIKLKVKLEKSTAEINTYKQKYEALLEKYNSDFNGYKEKIEVCLRQIAVLELKEYDRDKERNKNIELCILCDLINQIERFICKMVKPKLDITRYDDLFASQLMTSNEAQSLQTLRNGFNIDSGDVKYLWSYLRITKPFQIYYTNCNGAPVTPDLLRNLADKYIKNKHFNKSYKFLIERFANYNKDNFWADLN
jgi:hypothetical protein